jgi:hypothetical protein
MSILRIGKFSQGVFSLEFIPASKIIFPLTATKLGVRKNEEIPCRTFLSFGRKFGLAGILNSLIIRDFVLRNIQPEFLRTPSNTRLISLGYLLLAFLIKSIKNNMMMNQIIIFCVTGLTGTEFFGMYWTAGFE